MLWQIGSDGVIGLHFAHSGKEQTSKTIEQCVTIFNIST
jgi:hypothetical protein